MTVTLEAIAPAGRDPMAAVFPYFAGTAFAAVLGVMAMLALGPVAPLKGSLLGSMFAAISTLGLAAVIMLAVVSVLLRLVTERFAAVNAFALAALAMTVALVLLRVVL